MSNKITHFRLLSDLHLEFADFDVPELETDKTTLLILAGDIHVGSYSYPFLESLVHRFAKIVYVFGNHEYYYHDFADAQSNLQYLIDYPRYYDGLKDAIVLAGNEVKVIKLDGLRIIAGTLWTDMNNGDPMTALTITDYMNDYNIITKNGVTLKPIDTIAVYDESIAAIEAELQQPFDGKTIVVTHHAPTELAIHTRHKGYHNAHLLAGGYRTELHEFIEKYQPDFWCFGHTHDSCDIIIDKTRILNNCRGYPVRNASYRAFENPDFREDLVIPLCLTDDTVDTLTVLHISD